jgi:hypothetical protein
MQKERETESIEACSAHILDGKDMVESERSLWKAVSNTRQYKTHFQHRNIENLFSFSTIKKTVFCALEIVLPNFYFLKHF